MIAEQRLPQETKVVIDLKRARQDFPALLQRPRGKPLVYLDNAATTLKPQAVVAAVGTYYTQECANVHRGVHYLSEQATHDYEKARERIQAFLNAAEPREIVFVRGTTEAINLVAQTFGRELGPRDEILISVMEHHSNMVPWQIVAAQTGALVKAVPVTEKGELDMEALEALLGPRTRLVAITHMSNVLGTINPVAEIAEKARAWGARVLVDGAQAAPRLPVDVQALDCDFYALSGHKLYGPTGIGVLYGKAELLEAMPPYQSGGEMIHEVTLEKATYAGTPHKFEAGTPHVAGAIGLAAAIDYVCAIGIQALEDHGEEHDIAAYAPEPITGIPGLRTIALNAISTREKMLLDYATQALGQIPGLRLIGEAKHRGGVISMLMEGITPNDIGTVLDSEGVAIRAGHHCAMPLMDRFGITATARASLAFYNTTDEIDILVAALEKAKRIFGTG